MAYCYSYGYSYGDKIAIQDMQEDSDSSQDSARRTAERLYLCCIGRMYTEDGAWDQAVTVLEKSFEIRPQKYNKLFASNLWSLLWPGRAYAGQGKLKKAKTMYNFAMENAQRMLGPAHRTTIAISTGLIGIFSYKRPAGKTVKSKWESLIDAVSFLIGCAVSAIDEVERKFVERDRRM